ncbi:aspartate/glutamate racemase family protein [Luteibacter rhizovicinus]|nr:aspartate/glutamate racemase family protein [Luteibacter rhizovicinus]
MKVIGLIGGMSWESSAEYYRLINDGVKAALGGHNNARSLMMTVNFHDIETLQHEGRWDELGTHMADAARRLAAGGADVLLLCTNTMHKLWPVVEDAVDMPLIHIADPTAAAIGRAGFQKVGLLGTRFTMEQDFYRGRLETRHGLDVVIPGEADRTIVHSVIYDELCLGRVVESSRRELQRIVRELGEQGAQCVILGCTELMLLLSADDVSIPVFDTTALHAEAAVRFATGELILPER